MRIGFIGLGNMGSAMAGRLLQAGHELTVFNRTRSRAEKLQSAGARVADTPAAAASADVVITMLSDDAAVEEAAFGPTGLVGALPTGAIHVSMSTISPALSERLTEAHREDGQYYVAAPVLGRPEAAENAKLFILAAGPSEAIAKCQPLFEVTGQRTFSFGDKASSANVVKLSCNFMIASAIESMGEAFALIRKSGIDPQTFLELITGTLFSAPLYKTYGGLIASETYEPAGFKMPLGLKDIRLTLATGEKAAVPMPLASLIRDHMVSAIALGFQDLDWSALAKISAMRAGL